MTKEEALQAFFSSFGIEAYPDSAVVAGIELPYISYSVQTDSFSGEPVSLTVQIWYRTEREGPPSEKAQEIAEAISPGGKLLSCDGGAIWIKRGSPWCINTTAEGDSNIKVRQLNVTAEYLTIN